METAKIQNSNSKSNTLNIFIINFAKAKNSHMKKEKNTSESRPSFMKKIKKFLSLLSFRTGVIVFISCIPLYILSFAQLALPISPTLKGILWATLFGMAKAAQYAGLTILGAKGLKRLKRYFKRKE